MLPVKSGPPRLKHPELWDWKKQERLDKERESGRLCHQAEEFFTKQITIIPHSEKIESTSPLTLFNKLLQSNSGICIGELHTDSTKKWLVENLSELWHMGVTTLFLEHILHDSMQNQLDIYWQNPSSHLPDEIQYFLSNLDQEYLLTGSTGSFTHLVLQAHKIGMRIVAIDTSCSAIAGAKQNLPQNTKQRLLAMNFTAQEIIQKTMQASSGKFIALMGYQHGITTPQHLIPGVAEVIHCPFIRLNQDKHTHTAFANIY